MKLTPRTHIEYSTTVTGPCYFTCSQPLKARSHNQTRGRDKENKNWIKNKVCLFLLEEDTTKQMTKQNLARNETEKEIMNILFNQITCARQNNHFIIKSKVSDDGNKKKAWLRILENSNEWQIKFFQKKNRSHNCQFKVAITLNIFTSFLKLKAALAIHSINFYSFQLCFKVFTILIVPNISMLHNNDLLNWSR